MLGSMIRNNSSRVMYAIVFMLLWRFWAYLFIITTMTEKSWSMLFEVYLTWYCHAASKAWILNNHGHETTVYFTVSSFIKYAIFWESAWKCFRRLVFNRITWKRDLGKGMNVYSYLTVSNIRRLYCRGRGELAICWLPINDEHERIRVNSSCFVLE